MAIKVCTPAAGAFRGIACSRPLGIRGKVWVVQSSNIQWVLGTLGSLRTSRLEIWDTRKKPDTTHGYKMILRCRCAKKGQYNLWWQPSHGTELGSTVLYSTKKPILKEKPETPSSNTNMSHGTVAVDKSCCTVPLIPKSSNCVKLNTTHDSALMMNDVSKSSEGDCVNILSCNSWACLDCSSIYLHVISNDYKYYIL